MDIYIKEELYQTDWKNVTLVSHSDGREYYVWIVGIGMLTISYEEFLNIKKNLVEAKEDELKVYVEVLGSVKSMLGDHTRDIEVMLDRKLGSIRKVVEEGLGKAIEKLDSIDSNTTYFDNGADEITSCLERIFKK